MCKRVPKRNRKYIENQKITGPITTTSMLTLLKERNNEEFILKIITEKKTTLPSQKNQDRKKVKVETKKINK